MTDTDPHSLPLRGYMLGAVPEFVRFVSRLPGVLRIALVGSILTDKREPKDIDVLVTVEDDCDLAPLAKAGRRLQGSVQARNCGTDVFLANPQGQYIGRACGWRKCAPGIRMACRARHCGRRHYLHDDLHVVRLPPELIADPGVVLWPVPISRGTVPADVEALLATLRDELGIDASQIPASTTVATSAGTETAARPMEPVNLASKFAAFSDHWRPRIVGALNGQHLKVAKLHGEFVWHHHADADELFLVVRGTLTMRMRRRPNENGSGDGNGAVVEHTVREGEFLIVPRGVEHQPVAVEEVEVVLLEPAGTVNTGSAGGQRTVAELEWI